MNPKKYIFFLLIFFLPNPFIKAQPEDNVLKKVEEYRNNESFDKALNLLNNYKTEVSSDYLKLTQIYLLECRIYTYQGNLKAAKNSAKKCFIYC